MHFAKFKKIPLSTIYAAQPAPFPDCRRQITWRVRRQGFTRPRTVPPGGWGRGEEAVKARAAVILKHPQ